MYAVGKRVSHTECVCTMMHRVWSFQNAKLLLYGSSSSSASNSILLYSVQYTSYTFGCPFFLPGATWWVPRLLAARGIAQQSANSRGSSHVLEFLRDPANPSHFAGLD